MKKYLLTLIFALFFVISHESNIKAESIGTCIMSQFENTYEAEVPFYFYKATMVNTVNDSMVQSTNYTHEEILINNKEKCKSINGKTPEFIKNSNNILNYTRTTFHFSRTKLNDSENIYNSSIFLAPNFMSNGDYKITSEYISLDNSPPIIATENLQPTIITPVGTSINVELIKEKITAYDEVDGLISIKIHEDNYSANYKELGNYTIIFSATDNSNNTAYLTITIKIIDNQKPLISGQESLKSYMSTPLNIEDIKSTLTIKDNYYSLSNDKLCLIEDNYTPSINKEGYFTISFNITDPSNNVSDVFTVTIENYDDIAPSLTGETVYEVSNKTKLDADTIKNQLIIKDNVDENPIIEVTNDSYSNNYHNPGIYQITYTGFDKNNNASTPHTINITVKDTTKPTFYISKKFIGIDESFNVTIDELIDIIEATNNIPTNNLISLNIIKDEYTPNKNTPGTYLVELNYEYEDNENITIETYIVVDEYTNIKKEPKTNKKSFWDTIKRFILKIWNFIKQIFSFNWF